MASNGVQDHSSASARRTMLDLFRRETSAKTRLNFMAIAIGGALATAFIVIAAGLTYVEKIHAAAIRNENVLLDLMEIKAHALSTILLDPASPRAETVFADAGRIIQNRGRSALENMNARGMYAGMVEILSQWRDYERDSKALMRLAANDPQAAKGGVDSLYKKTFIPFQNNLESFIGKWSAMTDEAELGAAASMGMIKWSVSSLLFLITGAIVAMILVTTRSINATLRDREESNRNLTRAEEELRRFFDLVPDMVCVASAEGYFLKINPIWEKVLGHTERELLAAPFLDFIHPDDRDATMQEVARQIGGGATIEFANRYRCKDGGYKWLEWMATPSPDKKHLFAAARDITERRVAEEKLKAAKEAAEAATQLKDKFVSLVAHDLKNPLSSMTGFLKLVRDDETTPLDEGTKLVLDRAIETGKQLARLIDDLLSLNRLKTGQLKLDKQFFDAKYLGAKMCADFSHSAANKGVTLTNRIPNNSRIFADKTLLGEALQNLVTNAIKFCRQGDAITISLSDTDKTAIQVKDTGTGMTPEMVDRLFKFETKVSAVGTVGELGTGFGLPLTKDIMLLHGGDLEVASEMGAGCAFTLKLPYVRPRILIVDDDPVFRFALTQYLNVVDADIMEAEDGALALEILEKEKDLPHLIISDIEMPRMTGLELLAYMQKKLEIQSIPVIIVSGEHGMEIRDTVYNLGGKDFITKQLDVEDFIPRVRRFIG